MVHLAPGDPLSFITGEGDISSEQLARLRAEYGLDRPLATQYALYLKKIVAGDLGFSYRYRAPVMDLIVDRIPATLLLMGPSLALFIGLGMLLGIVAARRPNSGVDLVMSGVALVGWSVPVFWLGQLLLIGFALKLGWFPDAGHAQPARADAGTRTRARRRLAPRAAGHRARHALSRAQHADDALEHAAGASPRLHDHGAREGHCPSARC